ncbi:MAG: hypothetical protein J0I28_01995 [Caulobacterales bacterium]|nr:hypothetical protein [Caulobacterales bacterium]
MDRRTFGRVGLITSAAALALTAAASAQTPRRPAAPAPARPAAAPAATVQKVTGPRTVYWMDATTESGFAGMGAAAAAGGGGRPGLGGMMSMMRGMAAGGGGSHKLFLRFASNDGPGTPATTASHMTPPGAASENPLQLGYTAPTPGRPVPRDPSEPPPVERPKGKILLYSGCGPHVAAGQPTVIDLSKITDPATIATLSAAMSPSLGLESSIPPLPSNYKSYADGPRSQRVVEYPLTGSILGDHVVKSNAAPDINFNLGPGKDFLPPFNVTASAAAPDGSIPLTWQLNLNVRAIGLTAMGARQDGSIVMWANSARAIGWVTTASGFLTANDITKLTGDGTLLRGSTTTCTIPAEVFGPGAAGGIYNIYGYAPPTDIAFPPRPADPKVPWDIQWTTKVRYRTQHTAMLGMDMAAMGAAMGGPGAPGPQAPAAPAMPGMGGLLGRAIGGALGR